MGATLIAKRAVASNSTLYHFGQVKVSPVFTSQETYQKFLADRKCRIRGLWKHKGWFYAR
jgi:hypothetical protein